MLGMFLPSFFSGGLIARHGVLRVMLAGVALCAACLAINLSSTAFWALSTALVLLGIGWNFLFVGSTTLLTETYRPEERAKIEGLNDFLIVGVIAAFSFSAGALHHTDRGSQYAAEAYQALLGAHGMTCSMSRRGDCWDNAVAESFFASLKRELVTGTHWATRDEARTAVFDYIERWYNRERQHSSLGYLSPVAYERQLEMTLAA